MHSTYCYSQSNYTRTVDLNVSNETFSNVLLQLSEKSGLNFSYNSSDELFNSKITYSASNKQPLLILDELLELSGHSFKLVGNQIVIFESKTQNSIEKTQQPVIIPNVISNPITEEKFLLDTIYISDTVIKIHNDTVLKYLTDTIFRIDTVFIEKQKQTPTQPRKIKDIPVDYFNKQGVRENGWSGGVFFTPVISSFTLVRSNPVFDIRNFSMGIEISRLADKWNFIGGLKLSQFGEKYNNQYTKTEGGYFVTDTIDEYYTIINADTNYYYVTDSSWTPVNITEYNYDIVNRIGMLELAMSVSYDFYTSQVMRFYARFGAQFGLLIYNNGIAIPDKNNPGGVDFGSLTFKTQQISVLGGVGSKIRLSRFMDLRTEAYYLKYFSNLLDDYPNNTQIQGVGFKFGLIYYF